MKPTNPNFWTNSEHGVQLRNLEAEEFVYRHNIFPSWQSKQIDEPIMIYYEIYDCHGSDYIDDCLYQKNECYIKPGDIVVDLGANIGIFSRFASDKGAKKVFSFEPVQENFKLLSLNRPENCEAHRLAVSDTDNMSLKIAYKADAPGGSSIIKYDDGILQTCMSITIDTLVKNGVIEQPDFIKIDIEGAEILALKGASDDILKKVRCIVIEIHTPELGQEVEYIYNRLNSLGFKSFTLYNPDGYNIAWFTKQDSC